MKYIVYVPSVMVNKEVEDLNRAKKRFEGFFMPEDYVVFIPVADTTRIEIVAVPSDK